MSRLSHLILLILLILLLPFSRALSQPATITPHLYDNARDISFDPALDDTSFHLYDSSHVFQYYQGAVYWIDHKDSITRFILSRYQPPAEAASPADARSQAGTTNQATQALCKTSAASTR